jgi:hypothetical protein
MAQLPDEPTAMYLIRTGIHAINDLAAAMYSLSDSIVESNQLQLTEVRNLENTIANEMREIRWRYGQGT